MWLLLSSKRIQDIGDRKQALNINDFFYFCQYKDSVGTAKFSIEI